VTPFLIDWENSVHPTAALDQQCKLVDIKLEHPEPIDIQSVMTNLNLDFEINKGKEARISIVIQTAKGIVKL